MQQPDEVPLTPIVVDCVTFDRAPLGRRGYHEDQVDDFLDRVQATLSGADSLTAQDVREVVFDSAPLIRRGYHEDQVDDFLDLVEAELVRRARPEATDPILRAVTPHPAPVNGSAERRLTPTPYARPGSPAPVEPRVPDGGQVGDSPTVHAPVPTQAVEPPAATPPAAPVVAPRPPEPPVTETVTEPVTDPAPAAEAPAVQEQDAAPTVPEPTADIPRQPEPRETDEPLAAASPAIDTPALPETDTAPPTIEATSPSPSPKNSVRQDDLNVLALPLPPAPPGERGYRPGDVERLMTILVDAATDPDGPRADDIANLKLARTFFIGQGYHAGAIEALRLAWVSELRRREL